MQNMENDKLILVRFESKLGGDNNGNQCYKGTQCYHKRLGGIMLETLYYVLETEHAEEYNKESSHYMIQENII